MARRGITREEVFQAADSIQAQGKKVSVIAVRKLMGKGSFSTITPMLDAWRQEREKQQKDDLSVPEPLPEVSQAVQSIWTLSWKEAQKEFNAQRNVLKKETQNQIAHERQEMMEEIARLETELTMTGKEKKSLEGKLNKARQELGTTRENLASVKKETQNLEKDNERLEDELDNTKQELEKTSRILNYEKEQVESLKFDKTRLQTKQEQSQKFLEIQLKEEQKRSKRLEEELIKLAGKGEKV
jgi:septal ring factor EnvC (AmiA/AmiB activator)